MNVFWYAGLAVLILAPQPGAGGGECDDWVRNYSAVERELLTNEDLLVRLEEAFYPTDKHDNVVVKVKYGFEPRDGGFVIKDASKIDLLTELKSAGIQALQKQFFEEVEYSETLPPVTLPVTFRWLNSPIYMFINPTLLRSLSLHTCSPHMNQHAVELNFSVPCSHQELQKYLPDNSKCPTNKSALLDTFNHLTTNLQSYYLHKSSILVNGYPEDKEKGYSVYYYNPNKPSGYCILDEEGKYEHQRIYLGVGLALLLVFIFCGFPLGFTVAFKKFRERMMKEKTDFHFFTWSLVITSLLVSIAMILWDIYIVAANFSFYPSSHVEGEYMRTIHVFFILVIVLFIACLVLDIVLTVVTLKCIYLRNKNKFVKGIPIPLLFEKIIPPCCSGENNRGNRELDRSQGHDQDNQAEQGGNRTFNVCAESIAIGLGNVIMMIFLQLCGFHVSFVALGVLATPVSTLSLISFYIAFYFCLWMFLTVLLKVSDVKLDSLPWMLVSWILTIIVGIIGLVCIGFFVVYFYNYISMVQDDNYRSGVMVILGRILPTLIAFLLAYVGRKLVKYVGVNANSNTNEHNGEVGQNTE